ncbi:hypothetical protein M430DRAFT_32577 [Amorphotheca resinae ATCC 22711]|uniref:Uncharacterized protein n=1 Tax=Amorphotheca resinae ATCC 22711 TaxID=857342 RepID=A0A2T3BF72_AMORE|nr:hypothetical protein M430DRAFT_32577 [Amorphotheca resinae ATCC 22711]PSS28067.1 hypothetical protein M430DRAFT_32577 [Amorphotheca resinae ATCC 22711]
MPSDQLSSSHGQRLLPQNRRNESEESGRLACKFGFLDTLVITGLRKTSNLTLPNGYRYSQGLSR